MLLIPFQKIRIYLLLFTAGCGLVSCGGVGVSDQSSCVMLCGPLQNLRGAISSLSGNQAVMQGWVVAMFEKSTEIARVGEVDAAGLYQLKQAKTDMLHTIALLSPDYILQAVLSMPSPKPNTVQQWFRIKRDVLPKLVHKGPTVTFQDVSGIEMGTDLSSDQNGDGVPDGTASLGASLLGFNLAAPTAAVDTDLDGITNDKDPDIDGDGVINVLDPDDDGDGILDVFDGDANGDLINDNTPGQNLDPYFSEGVEFIAVQFEMKPKDDGSGNETSLKFTTKVRDDVQPIAVQMRGAPSLFNGANYYAKDASGNKTLARWDRLLSDDGLSEDSAANDRLFSRKVILENAKVPRGYQVVFFQLAFGSAADPWYMEFPYTFPPLVPATISAQYDRNVRTVLLVGNPYGAYQDFMWTINVFDSEGSKVIWSSQPVPGTTRHFQIPNNVLDPNVAYKYSVTAHTLDKVPSFPSYIIHSRKLDLK